MNKARVVIAAPKSGSGKTYITCALMRALCKRGLNVSGFKCGPDYIDPMFHKEILNVSSKNLDLFFTDEQTTRHIFLKDNYSDISVIEGVMGLYDGMGGTTSKASTYHLAQTLNAPVILVVDAKGMARSIVAHIAGFLMLDKEKLIRGVIINRVSPMMYKGLKNIIEDELHIKVLGFVPENKKNFKSRYLGLVMPNEIENIQETIDEAACCVEENVKLDELLEIANAVVELQDDACGDDFSLDHKKAGAGITVAVAMDEAFCFYYEDNLSMLRDRGVRLVEFSPLHDKKLPDNIQGVIFGGGYPELFAKELSENVSMRESIRQALNNKLPSIAECGGFMYLHSSIITEDGEEYCMVDALPGSCEYKGKLVRFGYIKIESKEDKEMAINAHEFHYYDSTANGDSCVATKPVTGRSFETSHVDDVSWWGFPHLYYPSNPKFVDRFISACQKNIN